METIDDRILAVGAMQPEDVEYLLEDIEEAEFSGDITDRIADDMRIKVAAALYMLSEKR